MFLGLSFFAYTGITKIMAIFIYYYFLMKWTDLYSTYGNVNKHKYLYDFENMGSYRCIKILYVSIGK